MAGDQVGKNGQRYFHLGDGPGGFFVGKIAENGNFIPAFKTREGLSERAIRTGKQVFIDTQYPEPRE